MTIKRGRGARCCDDFAGSTRLIRIRKPAQVKVGKTADLVLVEGDASERLSDLRQTRVVILDGKSMDADALRTAAGFSGLPK